MTIPMIWDVHCHLSGVSGVTPEARMAQLVAFADRMGVERMCVHMGMAWSQDPSPDELRQQNDAVLQAIGDERCDELAPRPDRDEALGRLDQALGFVRAGIASLKSGY